MPVYVALLRGINVGGKNIIKMKALKQVFKAMELCEVQTYIQSGNVLFTSNEEKQLLLKKIEDGIEVALGFPVNVVLRTAAELELIILNCPFSQKEILEAEAWSEVESLYVCLLTQVPLQEKIKQLDIYKNDSDDYLILGREVYLLLHNGMGKSKLANNLHKLEVPATVRNWKTMNKLAAMAKAMNIGGNNGQ